MLPVTMKITNLLIKLADENIGRIRIKLVDGHSVTSAASRLLNVGDLKVVLDLQNEGH